MTLTYSAVDKIPAIVSRLRAGFTGNRLKTVAQRRDALQRLIAMIDEFEPAFVAAAQADLSKPSFETNVMEISHMRTEAWGAYENVAKWMRPRSVHKEGIQRFDGAWIQPDPLGVVCVIGAWNYPFQLTVVGVIGAIAAGNTVLIKPSEVSPHCAEVIERAFAKYFDADVVGVVQGAAEETTVMLKERFDHILYTGNAVVARIVMTAAAKHLTPVTLELGGKSPVYVHSDADLNVAARRIVWGRTVNAGQTCIAPDYILAHDSVKAGLITALRKAIADFYGADPKASPDYGRIVNDRHFARVSNLIKSATVVAGGETDAATRYIAPTILDNVAPDCAAMQEEIFGPLFPVLPVANPEEAIEFINKREKPLALYVFTRTGAIKTAFREHTSSGAILINDTLMHAAFESLPFGGVGNSGMGAYHGQLTFDRFSHQKAVLEKDAGMEGVNAIRYAPYSERKQAILGALAGRVGPSWRWFIDLSATLLSVGASFLGFGRFAQAKKNKAE